jgi:hypothetical protein
MADGVVHQTAEEGHRVLALEKDDAKPIGGGITIHDEGLLEVREGEHGGCGDCLLEGGECSAGCSVQANPSFLSRAVSGVAIVPNSLMNLR